MGGIVGRGSGEINGCYNLGNINGKWGYTGGIVGQAQWELTILNCYNMGNVITNYGASGIIAFVPAETTVNNCYNIGSITSSSSSVKGIGGTTVTNCYNFGKLTSSYGISTIGGKTINSCYYKSSQKSDKENTEEGVIDVETKSIEEIVELLNSYKDDTGAYPADWKQWKKGDNGYPTFSD